MDHNTIVNETELTKRDAFLKMIELIPDAIVVVNKEGHIQFANAHAMEVFKYNLNELIGKKVELLIPGRYHNRHVKYREKYNHNPVKRPMGSGVDLFGQRSNGEEFPIDIMLSPINLEGEALVISVIRDISILKEKEESIKKQSRQLEDMISALTHDLKTPLVAAEINYKLLLEEQFGKLSKEQVEILNLLIKSNTGALKLVKNLLEVFKYEIGSYKLLLEYVEIAQLIEKARNAVSSMLAEKSIELKLPMVHFKFICDSFEVERVLVNLLTNAVRYTDKGGYIEIKVVKDENCTTTISVEDCGEGIPSEDIPKIFDRFWQSRKSNIGSQNTGLGLYLCKQIVEAHHGKIWVESVEGKGTKVSFALPAIFQ